MKKFVSTVLTILILITSVFSLNAFAQEQTRAEQWMQNLENSELEMQFTSFNEGQKTVSKLYIKDGNIAAISTLPLLQNYDAEIKFIIKDGYVYMYLTSFPVFYLRFENEDNVFQSNEQTEMIQLKSYEIQEGSTTYYIEEFTETDSESLVKYYFIDDHLKKIETYETDEYSQSPSSVTEILSEEVDDSVFRVPFFSINIAPLFDDFNIF